MTRRPTVSTKLSEADFVRFEQLCRLDGKTKTELLREAIRSYLKDRENEVVNERESNLELRMKKMEDRLAKLVVKVGLDVGTMHQLFWSRSDRETRAELFAECYMSAVRRMKKKLSEEEVEVAAKAKKLKP